MSAAVSGVAVHGVDGRLDLVRAGLVAAQAGAHDRLALGDQVAIPPAAILVGEQHQVTVRGARRLPGLREQHEREQAGHLWLVRHEAREQAAEPDRLGA